MSAPLTLAILLAIAIPVQLVRASRVDTRFVERWARDRGVGLTPENRPMVERYLRHARVLRTWGGVAGAILPSVFALVFSGRIVVLGFGTDGESAPLAFGSIFVGYLLGALYAEVSFARPAPGARRRASLARRELGGYVSRRAILAQRSAAAACALGAIAAALVPYADARSDPGAASALLGAVGVLALGAGLEAIERWLVRRPQPFTSPPLVAADDAIRAQSVQAVAGAGLAVLLLLCAGVALALQASDVAVLHSTMIVVAAGCLIASLFVCRDIGEGAWRVRRPAGAGDAASA
jgi:hypothetical protein